VKGVTGGQTGAVGHDLTQTGTYKVTHNKTVRAWLDEYRGALPEVNEALRPVGEQQLDQVAAEIAKDEPQVIVVNTLMGPLRTFAQNTIASAGAGAGTIGLTEVLTHWPFTKADQVSSHHDRSNSGRPTTTSKTLLGLEVLAWLPRSDQNRTTLTTSRYPHQPARPTGSTSQASTIRNRHQIWLPTTNFRTINLRKFERDHSGALE
jgi:hypothetical protein